MTPATDADDRIRLELWVWPDRDSLDADHDLVLRRARELEADGTVDGVTVNEWDHQINLGSDERSDPEDVPAREHVEAFREWARERGVTLPVGEPETAGKGRMGPEQSIQNLPRVMLAEYRGGELHCVVPHEQDGERHTIEDRLDELAG